MALHTWWVDDEHQRYWMEVATTGAMGEVLIAPRFPGADWSYQLVGQVRPGDRVLHWQATSSGRALVGWSVVTGEPEVVPEYTWQPRGTAGRALGGPRVTEGWMATLGGLNRFPAPVRVGTSDNDRSAIFALRASMEKTYGKPIYFPFYRYGPGELRVQQGYLVKFPVELFEVIAGIDSALGAVGSSVIVEDRAGRRQVARREVRGPARRSAQGALTRVQDPELRAAIENHAVDTAIEFYRAAGATDVVRLGKPYDIKLRIDDSELHVEVKGSSMLIDTVELTINEVRHAGDHQPTDLVVVDDIDWQRVPAGIETSGGRFRRWSGWMPSAEDLAPTRYAYRLPHGSDLTQA